MCDGVYDQDGFVCRPGEPLVCEPPAPGEVRYSLGLPGATLPDTLSFLEDIGGPTAGAGRAMRRIGINAPSLRDAYKYEVETLTRQVAERLERGQSVDEVAKWASEQRRQIVRRMRSGSGMVGRTIYEVRDWRKYGRGGRNYPNMVRYYQNQGVPASQISSRILTGAQRSNTGVNAAVRNASYLRHGGRVLLVVGVAISAARIWNASEQDLPRVISEELGGFIGGGLGAGAGVGICIVFGIASGGWGLLACGVVGGAAGGIGGSWLAGSAADKIFYSDVTTPHNQMTDIIIEVPIEQIYPAPPARMCGPGG